MKKSCVVFTHPSCLLHDTGSGHPEQIKRLEGVLSALKKPAFSALAWHESGKASPDQLKRVHDAGYVDTLLASSPASGYQAIDADTVLSPHTVAAALYSAGAVIDAVDHVMAGKASTAFCAVRPPGHHAEKDKAMGFCFFGNAAIGAAHAVEAHGLSRVAIIDFDVHHGNGTQDLVEGRKEIFFVSTHQSPLYPGTGAAAEKGRLGNIMNVPLAEGDDGAVFRKAFMDKILPALENFKPEMIIISAGFDAHRDDPLGGMKLTEADYAWVTTELRKIAETHGAGRVVSVMEGGYNLSALASSVAAHVDVLMQDMSPKIKNTPKSPGL